MVVLSGSYGEIGIFAVLVESRYAQQFAMGGRSPSSKFEAFAIDVLVLRDREIIFVASFFDAQATRDPRSAAGAQQVGVETGAAADLARFVAAVAEMQSYRVIGVAGNQHDSGFDFAAAELELYVIAIG